MSLAREMGRTRTRRAPMGGALRLERECKEGWGRGGEAAGKGEGSGEG